MVVHRVLSAQVGVPHEALRKFQSLNIRPFRNTWITSQSKQGSVGSLQKIHVNVLILGSFRHTKAGVSASSRSRSCVRWLQIIFLRHSRVCYYSSFSWRSFR